MAACKPSMVYLSYAHRQTAMTDRAETYHIPEYEVAPIGVSRGQTLRKGVRVLEDYST